MNSIRRFLVIVLLAIITLANFVAALQGYRSSVANTEALFDEQLVNLAEVIAIKTPDMPSGKVSIGNSDRVFFQVWQEGIDGKQLLYRSENAPDSVISSFQPGYHSATFNNNLWHTLTYQDKTNQHWIIVGEHATKRFFLAENIALQAILPNILALPLIGLLIWLVVGHGLKPLETLASALHQKKHNDLTPLKLTDTPVELSTVIQSTNDLLLRLENSFAREKRFSGDAAHELRTPLSALKIHLYNLGQQLPPDDKNMQKVNESIERMVHIIKQLLDLHRTTPEQFMANFTDTDLRSICQKVFSELWPKFEAKGQQVELQGNACHMTGDLFALETLVKNLVDNANKYTPAGGSILVSLHEETGFAILSVEDSGTGIPEELHQRVMERFYRVNGDQNNSMVTGCGLGLSIVQHIVELHGAVIAFAPSSFDTGLKVTVTFPLQNTNGAFHG